MESLLPRFEQMEARLLYLEQREEANTKDILNLKTENVKLQTKLCEQNRLNAELLDKLKGVDVKLSRMKTNMEDGFSILQADVIRGSRNNGGHPGGYSEQSGQSVASPNNRPVTASPPRSQHREREIPTAPPPSYSSVVAEASASTSLLGYSNVHSSSSSSLLEVEAEVYSDPSSNPSNIPYPGKQDLLERRHRSNSTLTSSFHVQFSDSTRTPWLKKNQPEQIIKYDQVVSVSDGMNRNSGVYRIMVKGRYRFGGELKTKEWSKFETWLCSSNLDGKREMVKKTIGGGGPTRWYQEWDCQLYECVWLEVVRVDGYSVLSQCAFFGVMVD